MVDFIPDETRAADTADLLNRWRAHDIGWSAFLGTVYTAYGAAIGPIDVDASWPVTRRTGDQTQIYVRGVSAALPIVAKCLNDVLDEFGEPREMDMYEPGDRFYLELHDSTVGVVGPSGIVTVYSGVPGDAVVMNIFVQDQLRRRGYGTLLMVAAARMFPEICWGNTPESEPFNQSLIKRGIAQKFGETSYVLDDDFKAKAIEKGVTPLASAVEAVDHRTLYQPFYDLHRKDVRKPLPDRHDRPTDAAVMMLRASIAPYYLPSRVMQVGPKPVGMDQFTIDALRGFIAERVSLSQEMVELLGRYGCSESDGSLARIASDLTRNLKDAERLSQMFERHLARKSENAEPTAQPRDDKYVMITVGDDTPVFVDKSRLMIVDSTEWHLTPRGWERGTETDDTGVVEEIEPPDDRVLTARYYVPYVSCFGPFPDETDLPGRHFEAWRSDDADQVATLLEKFGPVPMHY
jgi:hypothetical protein